MKLCKDIIKKVCDDIVKKILRRIYYTYYEEDMIEKLYVEDINTMLCEDNKRSYVKKILPRCYVTIIKEEFEATNYYIK